MLRTIGNILVRVLAAIGMVTVILGVWLLVVVLSFREGREPLPDRIVLQLSIDGEVKDGRSSRSFLLGDPGPTVREMVAGLYAATRDDRVAGVAAYLGGASISLADAQELRDAIAAFRASGKFARVFSDDLGGIGGGTGRYYLATSFDEIWLQPSGGVGLIGMSIEVPFVRGALDKLDVETRMGTRHEYKSAVETFTRTALSDPARENLQTLLGSLFDQVAAGIAERRDLTQETVRSLVDGGPYLAEEARQAGLVDRLGYFDEFLDGALQQAGNGAETVKFRRYLRGADGPDDDAPQVALIYGLGPITAGDVDDGGLLEEPGFAAYTIADAIADAVEDDSIKAILLRIDSPGGSYVASDIVWREVSRARDAGKPVIASMAGTAASGGYFVAMAANRIVAHPATVTGSIGVYGGKVVTRDLWERVGVTWDGIRIGKHANMWSFVEDFPPGAEQRFSDMLDFIYRDFTGKVMADRNLDEDQVDAAARGRVWTGRDAQAMGLVDSLGGYSVALDEIREALGMAPGDDIRFVLLPERPDPLEQLLDALSGESPFSRKAALFGFGQGRLVDDLRGEFGQIVDDLSVLRPRAGVLEMPPIRIRH